MSFQKVRAALVAGAMVAAVLTAGCDDVSSRHGGGGTGGTGGGGAGGTGGNGGGGGTDPGDCASAAAQKSYVGCDYWPTVTPNPCGRAFDFAVVVANPAARDADVTVTGAERLQRRRSRSPPASCRRSTCRGWRRSRARDNMCGAPPPLQRVGARPPSGAYHLVSRCRSSSTSSTRSSTSRTAARRARTGAACINDAAACGGGRPAASRTRTTRRCSCRRRR